MELLAAELTDISGNLADHAFMTGIMSLMPALLQTPMDEILDSLPLLPEVRTALETRDGTLGRLLSLAESIEADDETACFGLSATMAGMNSDTVNRAQTAALAWVASIDHAPAGGKAR
jgi:EAL and modified HD-GYP domain-containing signal transduction protein